MGHQGVPEKRILALADEKHGEGKRVFRGSAQRMSGQVHLSDRESKEDGQMRDGKCEHIGDPRDLEAVRDGAAVGHLGESE